MHNSSQDTAHHIDFVGFLNFFSAGALSGLIIPVYWLHIDVVLLFVAMQL